MNYCYSKNDNKDNIVEILIPEETHLTAKSNLRTRDFPPFQIEMPSMIERLQQSLLFIQVQFLFRIFAYNSNQQ